MALTRAAEFDGKAPAMVLDADSRLRLQVAYVLGMPVDRLAEAAGVFVGMAHIYLAERAADDEIARLHAEGASLRQIGRAVGYSHTEVRRRLSALNLAGETAADGDGGETDELTDAQRSRVALLLHKLEAHWPDMERHGGIYPRSDRPGAYTAMFYQSEAGSKDGARKCIHIGSDPKVIAAVEMAIKRRRSARYAQHLASLDADREAMAMKLAVRRAASPPPAIAFASVAAATGGCAHA